MNILNLARGRGVRIVGELEMACRAISGQSDSLSGVPIIDTMVASHLLNVIDALKLVGINVILTGIRPEIAQTIVNIGIRLDGISTFGSLHHAIKSIQNNLQTDLHP
ncbi:MAG: STAS domain-containing protein [Desulfobacteraceae bacterium]|nr:MAG: STAS domain-containing protein [Desulfobacteraceae bacterium]